MGDEAYRLYGTLLPGVKADGETDFDLALRQLREFYTPRTSVIVERFNFRQRGQHDNETTADFVSALRGLARTCGFGSITDELIRAVVAEKTVHPRLREPFLQDKDLTREKVLVMAEAYRMVLKPGATPTAYLLRRLPLSVREEVSAELQRLLHNGITEKIDASE